MKATEVFTPSEQPTHTYVERFSDAPEQQLRNALSIPNMAISLSGPSKTGKTVLVRKVLSDEHLINVSGASLQVVDDLWKGVLDWMDVPASITTTSGSTESANVGVQLGLTATGGTAITTSSTSTPAQSLFNKVISEIANSDFVVFIDDFHYIPSTLQVPVARQIKAIAEKGVKVCVASVPHHSDDVVRGNPELRGRVSSVDTGYWTQQELKVIATKGFGVLNMDLAPSVVDRLAKEACGSPQLMQILCLNLCFATSHNNGGVSEARIEITDEDFEKIFSQSSHLANFATLTGALHSGPKQRGTERNHFNFTDGSSGDVYRAILLVLANGEPSLSRRYDEIIAEVAEICAGEKPYGSSISSTLQQMMGIAQSQSEGQKILEWENDVLTIADPYFLFYLRCSDHVERLGKA